MPTIKPERAIQRLKNELYKISELNINNSTQREELFKWLLKQNILPSKWKDTGGMFDELQNVFMKKYRSATPADKTQRGFMRNLLTDTMSEVYEMDLRDYAGPPLIVNPRTRQIVFDQRKYAASQSEAIKRLAGLHVDAGDFSSDVQNRFDQAKRDLWKGLYSDAARFKTRNGLRVSFDGGHIASAHGQRTLGLGLQGQPIDPHGYDDIQNIYLEPSYGPSGNRAHGERHRFDHRRLDPLTGGSNAISGEANYIRQGSAAETMRELGVPRSQGQALYEQDLRDQGLSLSKEPVTAGDIRQLELGEANPDTILAKRNNPTPVNKQADVNPFSNGSAVSDTAQGGVIGNGNGSNGKQAGYTINEWREWLAKQVPIRDLENINGAIRLAASSPGGRLARAVAPSALGAATAALTAADAIAREETYQKDPSLLNRVERDFARVEVASDTAGAIPGPQSFVAEPAGLVSGLLNVSIDALRDGTVEKMRQVRSAIRFMP